MKLLIKSVLSNGCVLGRIKKMNNNFDYIKSNASDEISRFIKAREISINQINELKLENKDMTDYLTIQELMLADPIFEKKVTDLINDNNSVVTAIQIIMNEYKEGLNNSSSTYLQERIVDIDDVTYRVINNLNMIVNKKEIHPYVLSAEYIYPSYLISNKDNLMGIIVKKCGYTSHSAIMCRSWDIPLVISDDEFESGDIVAIDTAKNIIIKNPDSASIEEYTKKIKDGLAFDKKAIIHDGYLFLANVGSNEDLKRVNDYGFDGVGLYRTEMIFMNNDRPLSFDEQYKIYSEAVEIMKDKSVCFRLFDIGDDKQLPYLKASRKGVDNYKNNPLLFIEQVKALLCANKYGNMRIMFPMIETYDDFIYLKKWVLRIREENKLNMPSIGMMLETKEALNNIESFKDVDFISIGTNDLTAELYKLDRDNAIEMLDEYKTDLIERLKRVVKFCDDNNISLSVCGELAAVPRVANLFYSIGIKNLSVAPSGIRTLNSIFNEFKNE